MAKVLGVTGGIGTGKSTVTKMFADLGAETMSADEIAREVLKKGNPAYAEVVNAFGDAVLSEDGDIDRSKLAAIIFADFNKRRALEEIMHPPIIARMRERAESFRKDPPAADAVLVLEIPLLIECGLNELVDEVLLVAAEQETQLSRLTSSRAMSREDALARIKAQMPLSQKLHRADRVIWNDGTLDVLKRRIEEVWAEILLP